MKSFKLESNEEKRERKKNSIFSWKLSNEELKNQLENYHNLLFFKSYKGISVIVLFYFIISAIIAVELKLGPTLYQALPAIILYCLLLIFIYRGHRWSFILLMIMFTGEMVYKEIEGYEMFNKIRVYPIVWWFFIMPFLYKALKVEIERKKIQKQNKIIKNKEIETTEISENTKNKFLFCQNCGKKNISEANYCKKCGSKIIK